MQRDFPPKSVLVLGCGNILRGDDGFGPTVIRHLQKNYPLPKHVLALDVGTRLWEFLLDLMLSERKPEKIIIVEAVSDSGYRPGEVFEIPVENLSDQEIGNFSAHLFPSSHVLRKLKEFTGVDLILLMVQVQEIPAEIKEGLTPAVAAAVEKACQQILRNI
jgi:coenzyme F420 hydrogenase subunit delta